MTEEDVEVCAVICAVGLLCDWKCNMNRKQFQRQQPYSDHNSQENDFIFKVSLCPSAFKAFQNGSRCTKPVKYQTDLMLCTYTRYTL